MNLDLPIRTVRIPVRWNKGVFELLDNSPLPEMKDGTIGDLVVDAESLVKPEDRAKWTKEKVVRFLPSGSSLWARVKPESVSQELIPFRLEKREWPGTPLHAVEFVLKTDLTLILRAGKKAALSECACYIPALKLDTKSVNEAYTKISVAFEPGRRSHAGNVFLCVFYECNGTFRPLDDRRTSVEVTADSQPAVEIERQQSEMNLKGTSTASN
jgi:hypothetical protein